MSTPPGVPLRIEIGPRDLAKNAVAYARRDTGSKGSISNDGIVESIKVSLSCTSSSLPFTRHQGMLDTIHTDMFNKALKTRDERMKTINKSLIAPYHTLCDSSAGGRTLAPRWTART